MKWEDIAFVGDCGGELAGMLEEAASLVRQVWSNSVYSCNNAMSE